MELADRDRELDLAAGALDDVRGGGARVLGVVGEAGIGKTALLSAFAARAAGHRLLVLTGRGVEHERELPFGLAMDVLGEHVAALDRERLESLGPELGAVLPRAEAPGPFRARRRAALPPAPGGAGAARAARRASARSRCCWTICTGPTTRRWSWSCTCCGARPPCRTCSSSPRAPVRWRRGSWTPRAARPASRSSRSSRSATTPRSACWPMCATSPCGGAWSREAGGNPLFLRALARAAGRSAGALPRTLVAAVGVRAGRLPARDRTLLEGAAVAGDPFDPELAAAAASLEFDAAALDRLVAADLVRATGDGRAVRVPPPACPARGLRRRAARLAADGARARGRRARGPRRAAGRPRLPRRTPCRAGRRGGDRADVAGRSRRRRDRAGQRRPLVRDGAAAAAGARARTPGGADGAAGPRARRAPGACRRVATRSSMRSASPGPSRPSSGSRSSSPAPRSRRSSARRPTRGDACSPRYDARCRARARGRRVRARHQRDDAQRAGGADRLGGARRARGDRRSAADGRRGCARARSRRG